jgi:hypothetical protein
MELDDETFFKRMQSPEEVENWLADIEREIDAFMQAIPAELRDHLDYSVASIDHLEKWLLSLYTKLYDAYSTEGLVILAGAGCYVGEVIRKSTGAEWYVELNQKNNAFLGFPVLRKNVKNPEGRLNTYWSQPFSLLTASFSRRTGTYIRGVAENFIRDVDAVE